MFFVIIFLSGVVFTTGQQERITRGLIRRQAPKGTLFHSADPGCTGGFCWQNPGSCAPVFCRMKAVRSPSTGCSAGISPLIHQIPPRISSANFITMKESRP